MELGHSQLMIFWWNSVGHPVASCLSPGLIRRLSLGYGAVGVSVSSEVFGAGNPGMGPEIKVRVLNLALSEPLSAQQAAKPPPLLPHLGTS